MMLVLITPLRITLISIIITALKMFNICIVSHKQGQKSLMKQKGYTNEPNCSKCSFNKRNLIQFCLYGALALNSVFCSFSFLKKYSFHSGLAVFAWGPCCQAPAGLVSQPLSLFSYKLGGSLPAFLMNTLSRTCWLKCTSALLVWVAGDAAIKIKKKKKKKKNSPRIEQCFCNVLTWRGQPVW